MEHLYALTFIPLLLITLAVHELGHLIAARLLKVKVAAFQIGMGTRLLSISMGRTPVTITPATTYTGATGAPPAVGDYALVFVREGATHHYEAVSINHQAHEHSNHQKDTDPLSVFSPFRHFPFRRRQKPDQPADEYNRMHMQISGKVTKATPTEIVLADVMWSLRLIPVMAAVFMPTDPSGQIHNAHNNAGWRKKLIITLAGPAANLVFLAAVLAALALVPFQLPRTPLITIDSVAPNSPADQAGVQQGDYIIQINNTLVPRPDELVRTISKAMLSGDTITLHLRRGPKTHTIKVRPDPDTGLIGITVSRYIPPPAQVSMHPGPVKDRFFKLTNTYFNATVALISAIGDAENDDPILSSPLMTAHYTAQAVEHANIRAWLAILAVLTLGCAVLNLLPIPPLDGYHIVTDTIQALRHNKPLNPIIEGAVTMAGISIIITATLYLLTSDIIHLLG